MATRSKYQVQLHSQVTLGDLPALPPELREDFDDFCHSLFIEDPYGCLGLAHHLLKGKLRGYRALEIDWNHVSYRLVYRIYEKPAPKRVFIISFAEHDAAYAKAIARQS